jgi:hypothetical protein
MLGLFFAFATVICMAAAWSLLDPQSPAARMWAVKAHEYRELLALGPIAGIGFLALSAAMAAASIGSFAAKEWGWRLAVAIIAINAVGDAARALTGGLFEGIVGLAIAGTILRVLFRPRIRNAFTS